MFNKLKQIRDLRAKAKRVQTALKDESAEGTGAWGKIKIKMSGNQEVLEVSVDPDLLKPEEQKKLEAGLREAINAAIKKVQRVMVEKMQKMGELKL